MTTRVIHEGRGWSLYVNGTRRLYEESYGVVCAVAGCMRDPPLLALLRGRRDSPEHQGTSQTHLGPFHLGAP